MRCLVFFWPSMQDTKARHGYCGSTIPRVRLTADGFTSACVSVKLGCASLMRCHVSLLRQHPARKARFRTSSSAIAMRTTAQAIGLDCLMASLPNRARFTSADDELSDRRPATVLIRLLSAYQQAEHHAKQCSWDAHCLPPENLRTGTYEARA